MAALYPWGSFGKPGRLGGFHCRSDGYEPFMTSFTSEIPQLVEKLTDAAPTGFSHLRDSTEPVVERLNEALGRSSGRSRPSLPWLALGVVGVVGVVAAIVIMTRRRNDNDNSVAEDRSVRLAS